MRKWISLLVLLACSDPTHDALLASLGPEDPSVPRGESHRPGQPCLACHGDQGPAKTQFAVGGTIYKEDLTTPAEGAIVQLNDAAQASQQATTNAVGNFFILFQDWQPTFPITPIMVATDPNNQATMITHIGRDGSCATCHFGQPSSNTPGPVYVTTP